MTKIKNTTQLKRIVSAFLLISALGISIAAQNGNIVDDRSGQTVGSGGYTSGGLIGSGTATASPDSGSSLESLWNWFEGIF